MLRRVFGRWGLVFGLALSGAVWREPGLQINFDMSGPALGVLAPPRKR